MPENKKEYEAMQMIPADKAIMHMNFANRRMLIALLSVCITFILTIVIFVVGYTVREKNWLGTIIQMQSSAITEVQNGPGQN